MSIETLEYVIVSAIVGFQFLAFNATLVKIRHFKKLIPSEETKIKYIEVENEVFVSKKPNEILAEWQSYIVSSPDNDVRQVPLVCSMTGEESNFEKLTPPAHLKGKKQQGEWIADKLGIKLSDTHLQLSSYLLSNVGLKPDFVIMKDVVERHSDALEHEIQIHLPLPLFLGLIGTFAGIVVGLFGMGSLDFSGTSLSSEPINILLNGVKIAMIASGMGLLLTVIANALVFRPAKMVVERRKSAMLNYLETSLMPELIRAAQSTEQETQIGIHTAAVKELNKQIKVLQPSIESTRGIVEKLLHIVETQAKMLDHVNKLDLPTVSKYNQEFFHEVSGHLDKLEKFSGYLQNVNSFLANSSALNATLLDVLNRTSSVETIMKNIGETVNGNREFQEYVHSHFKELKAHGTMMLGTVGKVDDAISKSIEELEDSVQMQVQAFRLYANEQIDALRNELKVEQGVFNQLMHLETLNTNFQNMTAKTIEQNYELLNAVKESNVRLMALNESMGKIRHRKSWMDKLIEWWTTPTTPIPKRKNR